MRLIVAANRAPLRYTADEGWLPAIGGLATALLPVLQAQGGAWVAMKDQADLPELQPYPKDNPDFVVHYVPLSTREREQYYNGMANRMLWPLCHYMVHHLRLRRSYMEAYRAVNQRFATTVIQSYQPGDVIWVHDYHLMLVPGLVRRAVPEAVIAHFWHIPWPAMEVYRILPWSRELLQGMLACQVVGFHVEEYVENFLESARYLLGARIEGNRVLWEGREVRVEAHPLGVDIAHFEQMAQSEAVQQKAQQLREEIGTEWLMLGVDRLDYTKGIRARLLAFERFLEMYPEYHGRVSFYQVATPSRTQVTSYQQLKREVDEVVGRINGQFGRVDWTPVHYRYRTYTQEELCVFYRAADVACITPLRDGMNLVAQEFIAASQGGTLILSELTGASHVLREAVLVNPYDVDGLASAMRMALEMPIEERMERFRCLKRSVQALDVHRWAARFFETFTAMAQG
ncbi:alpha,alpha-trehalose-phosphate synthase (UDP-forming) [Rhodothermus bifroesti]|uniref:alpha,alpha-trehalose-phosphate synthase (UDP-forming) n=1 Tax=Rhodothermus bifroesti TaxID=2823335 RepID=UPI000CC13FF3|nr:Trehalose-6-phosphate synthase [bacterium HR18]